MTPTQPTFGQPTLADLMVRFLATRPDAAPAAAVGPAETEVEPHEVAAGFAVDARAAWTETLAAAGVGKVPMPGEWAALVAQPAAAFAVPMAAGNYPQRVKDLHPLLARFDPQSLRPSTAPEPMAGFAGLRKWVERQAAGDTKLLAAGLARALGDGERAGAILADIDSSDAVNERAALLWQTGRCAEALAAWEALADSPAVLFNRGMARLFLGQFAEAREALTAAVAALPDAGGWNALARLYLTVAEING